MQRQATVNKGGITYSEGAVAFPTGTQFSVTDEDTFLGFDDIIDYIVNDRLQRSRQPISNALLKTIPGKTRVSFAEALLSQIPVIEYEDTIPLVGTESRVTWENNFKNEVIRDLFDNREGFYILKSNISSTRSNVKIYSLWCYTKRRIDETSENLFFNVISEIATEVAGQQIVEESATGNQDSQFIEDFA
jgi:hypothetical protein